MKQKKIKIKIPKIDINTFSINEMKIDDKWIDLYFPKESVKKPH